MIKIVIIDDHQIVVEGLKAVLKDSNKIEVVGTGNNMREGISQIKKLQPDILLTDLNMPGKNGVEMLKEFEIQFPRLKIIVLTMYFDNRLLKELNNKCNIKGCLPKNCASDELKKAINNVYKGENLRQVKLLNFNKKYDFAINLNDEIKDTFVRKYSLGTRELEVFTLVAMGKNSQEIANSLHLSTETISTHRRNIKRKTGLENTAQIAAFAVRNQLI